MKKCRICNEVKNHDRFRRGGKICRKCANKRNEKNRKDWENKNKERLIEYRKTYKASDKYKKNPKTIANIKKQRRKGIDTLRHSYVYTTLYSRGFSKEQITDDLIKTQTEILKIKRLCKTLKN